MKQLLTICAVIALLFVLSAQRPAPKETVTKVIDYGYDNANLAANNVKFFIDLWSTKGFHLHSITNYRTNSNSDGVIVVMEK